MISPFLPEKGHSGGPAATVRRAHGSLYQMPTSNDLTLGTRLRPDQAGAILGMSPHTLANWRVSGYGPPWARFAGTIAGNSRSGWKNRTGAEVPGMPVRNRNGKLEWRFKVAKHEYSHITDLADTPRNRIAAQRLEPRRRNND